MKNKKKKYTMLLKLLVIMILIPFIKVKADSMDSYIDWNLDRTVFAHQYRDGSDHITNLAMITANGKIAYCIEPGVVADKGGTYNSTYDINDTNLKNIDIKRLSLIGYYGYGYKNHSSKEYYMATQELVWRLMGVENVWWTDSKYGGNVLNIESYKNEILSLVDSYEISPKFNFKDKYVVGDEITLQDVNNVLSEYEIVENKNVSINGNSISIKIKQTDNNFILRRKSNGQKPIFYYKAGYQTIGSFEYAYDYSSNYNVLSEYGKIIVNKKDKDTNSKLPFSPLASLQGAEYTLYDANGKVIDVETTNNDGIAIFNNLVKGTYYVKETKASTGYTFDINSYQVNVSTDSLQTVIDSYEKVIKNKIVVTKVLEDKQKGTMIPEEGIEFGLYEEDGTLIEVYVTNKDGVIELELPYGKYILKQHTIKEGISVADDKLIEVIDDNENQNITIINHKLEDHIPNELPNTGKDYDPSCMFFLLTLGFIYKYERKNT